MSNIKCQISNGVSILNKSWNQTNIKLTTIKWLLENLIQSLHLFGMFDFFYVNANNNTNANIYAYANTYANA